jgi:argininosuccinate lyase
MKKKIWHKAGVVTLNEAVENYNAGEDINYDQEMIGHDVKGSRGYARLLNRHKIVTNQELAQLEQGLDEIVELWNKGEFQLALEDEDCHTKIEDYLVEHFGDAGKKIHTGRSRNDQVLVMMRLFLKDKLTDIINQALQLASTFTQKAKEYEMMPMPGYTHMQKAMPTTVGTWFGAMAESLLDDVRFAINIRDIHVDQNPLGSGAGYGSPFDFDRDWLSTELGFAKTQNNVIYCHNSRGRIEGLVLEACVQLMLTLNRFASDILFYTTQEFQFFTMADEIATGSSIMPQKKNLDCGELLRGRCATVLAAKQEMNMNVLNKISGYHRDGQEIKRPLFLGLKYTQMSLEVAEVIINNIKPNKEVLLAALTPPMFAAHKAFEHVKHRGITFRDAYRAVGSDIKNLRIDKEQIEKWLQDSTHQGGTGNLMLGKLSKEISELMQN